MSQAPPLVATLLVLALAPAQPAAEQGSSVATGFLPKTISLDGRDHRYVVCVPPGYTNERSSGPEATVPRPVSHPYPD